MNGYTRSLDLDEAMPGYDDESFDDESFDDESYRSAEFIPGLGLGASLLPGIASGIGNVIGGLFGGQRRPPVPQVQVRPSGSGVSTANLQTPAGSAVLRLPEPVPTREEFRQAVERLEGAINTVTTRANTTQNDLQSLTTRVGAVVADTQKDVAKVRMDTRRMLMKAQQVQKARAAKLRQEIRSQQTTNLFLSIMLQQQLQDQIEEHTHSLTLKATDLPTSSSGDKTVRTGASDSSSSDNNALLFLPLMMMGSPGGSGGNDDNNMMMMAMMMFAINSK